MKKRTKVIVLAVFVLLVVSAALIWNVRLANSSSVQAWIRVWLENPIGLTAIATVGAAIGTIGAVVIALYGTRYERKKAREERDEAQKRFLEEQKRAKEVLDDERKRFQEAQEEGLRQFLETQKQTREAINEGRRQFLETQYAANKPLLVPKYEQYPEYAFWPFSIHNDGTGIAINITILFWGIGILDIEHLSICYVQSPIPKNQSISVILNSFNILPGELTPNDKIGTYTFGILDELAFKEHSARLTLTYFDVFGRKHASIFDYVAFEKAPGSYSWQSIAFLSDIPQDINEMIEARNSQPTKDSKP